MKKIFLSAILAGAVIAFGGTVFLSVENTVVGSLFFTIGLFVVCTRGLHLFTGKVCYVFDNDAAYAKTLPVIWLGNLAGTSLIALAEKCTRLVSLSARAQGICELKLSEPLFGAFILAVFCNVHFGTHLLQNLNGDHCVDFVIFRKEDVTALEAVLHFLFCIVFGQRLDLCGLLRRFGFGQVQVHGEIGTLARLAFDNDFTAH